ncbi:MAG: hypothetical protein AB8C46_02410 [Burkholderiaceae bacterium]
MFFDRRDVIWSAGGFGPGERLRSGFAGLPSGDAEIGGLAELASLRHAASLIPDLGIAAGLP